MTKSAWSISKRLVRTRTFIATLSARRLAGIGGRCGGTVRNTLLRAGNLVGVLNSVGVLDSHAGTFIDVSGGC